MTTDTPEAHIAPTATPVAATIGLDAVVRNHTPRLTPRRRVFKGALVAYEGLNTAIPCSVRDLSDGGAQLRLDGAMIAPNHFTLFVDLDGTETDCEVVWRKGRDLGVRFRSAARPGTRRRMQVVGSMANPEKPKQKPQLRKQPRDNGSW